MFFSLFRQRDRTKRDHVARFRLDKMLILRSVLRDSLRSNKSSHRLRRRTQSSHFIANLLAIATLGSLQLPKGEGAFGICLLPREIADQVRNEGPIFGHFPRLCSVALRG